MISTKVDNHNRLTNYNNNKTTTIYNMATITNRKKRTDRNHVIYELVNTITGASYLGITAAIGRRFNYSAVLRFQKHCSRARRENKGWKLYTDMREYGTDVYDVFVLDIVRGKAAAHQLEVKLLKQFNYELNSTH